MKLHKALGLCALLVLAQGSAWALRSTGDLLELIDTTRLPELRLDEGLQVSSYDRSGGNDDGFSGTNSALREENGAFVIFEDQGPGCVYRIWSANPGPRRIEFYFDGETEPRLAFDKFEDMFLNKQPPFVAPLSVNAMGGWTSYVPLPYRKSLKIVTRERINFYQITYRKFPKAMGVKTFTPELGRSARKKLDRVVKAWNALGENPWPEAVKESFSAGNATIEPGKSALLGQFDGAGSVYALKLRVESTSLKVRREAVLRVTVDGAAEPQVNVPLGDFFLAPFPTGASQGLLCGSKDGVYYSYWPMPFANGIRVELVNDGALPLTASLEWGGQRGKPGKNTGRFHATWHRQNPTEAGKLFPILEATGRGQWCGVSHAMQGEGPGLGFLEGDEMLWIDGRDNTAYNGTGTEDYFNGGWYFGKVGSQPLWGCGYLDDPQGRCHAYRLQTVDLIPFQQTFRGGIEHGHANEYIADYAGVTFGYFAPDATVTKTPIPAVKERLWQSVRAAAAREAENVCTQGTGDIVSDADLNALFSGGKALRLAQGQEAVLKIEVPTEDVYDIRALSPTTFGAARLVASIDNLNTTMSCEAEVSLGRTRLKAGTHDLHVRAVEGTVYLDAVRILPSERVASVTEAEAIRKRVRGGATTHVVDGQTPGASGDSYLEVSGRSPRAGIDFSFETSDEGPHDVRLRLLQGPNTGQVRVAVDGHQIGEEIDCRADQPGWMDIRVGPSDTLLKGKHTLTLSVADKTRETFGIDFFALNPTGVVEGEFLKITATNGGKTQVQPMKDFGPEWSNGAQLFFTNELTSPGGYVDAEWVVTQEAECSLRVFYTQAPDFGIVQVSLDGKPIGQPFDGYAPKVMRAQAVELGKITATPGKHTLRFEVTGKNERSKAWLAGIDRVEFK